VLSLALAWSGWRFSLHRPLLRFWHLFPALLLLILIAAPVSVWAGRAYLVSGHGWWTRSTGQGAFLLALIFSLSLALPRFARGERGGLPALVGCLLLSALLPFFFLKSAGMLFVGFAIAGLMCSVVLPLKRLALALLGFVPVLSVTMFLWVLLKPGASQRLIALFPDSSHHYQLLQALISVQTGGLIGHTATPVWIPEWHTDFLFARLCNAGGMAAGVAALLVTGLLLVLAWRITGRQTDLTTRALAAGCAAALTAPALLHIGVNLGLLPTMALHFPFFSYAPRLLLLDGLLLGLLLSMLRKTPAKTADEPTTLSSGAASPARWPIVLIQAGVALLLALFALRLCVLVFFTRPLRSGYTPVAERQKPPVRGRILDVKSRVLAQTCELLIACADPKLLANSDEGSRYPEIARLIGMEEQAVRDLVASNKSRRYVRLKKGVTRETADAIRRLKLKTFFIDSMPARDYPFATPLAHLVGCTGSAEDYRGLSGIEVAWNAPLKAGGDMRLTLDIDLQTTLQGLAEAAIKETRAKRAQIVVMDARTGALRAAAQAPALHGRGPYPDSLESMRWSATGEVFEPGGLLKPLVAAAALEKGAITTESRINCEQGVWTYKGLPLRDPGQFGELTPAEILQKSSNIGMAKIGLLLGEGALYEAVTNWGMNQSCTAGLNTAERGILHATNRWSKLEVTRLPIGHGCAGTLLQLLRAYSALFNDGRMIEPTLIAATRTAPGTDWHPSPVSAPKSVIRPETVAWLRSALKKDLADGLTTIGQPAIVQKTLTNDTGYDTTRVLTAFIGSLDINGTPLLIAVWLDEPTRDTDPNPAVGVFIKSAQAIRKVQP
jgi:cell division protein FtsI (penicillin-binding protein 3)